MTKDSSVNRDGGDSSIWFVFFIGVCIGGIVDCLAHMVSK